MLRDAIKEITGIFDQRFLMYIYAPVVAFCLALMAVWFSTHQGLAKVLVSWRSQGTFDQILQVSGFLVICFVLATVMANMLASLTRLFEGYWDFPGGSHLAEIGTAWHQRVLRRVNYENVYHSYPPREDSDEVMPTRLGNILKNAELYPESRYGIQSVLIWPRLNQLLPPEFLENIAGARGELEFMLLIATLSTAFGTLAGGYLFIVGARWWVFLACAWGGFALGWIAYRTALSSAHLYGILMKVAFDLHRKDALKQLGFPVPENMDAEKALWKRVCRFLFRNAKPYESYRRPAGANAIVSNTPTRDSELADTLKLSLSHLAMLIVFATGAWGALLLVGQTGFFNRQNSATRLVIIQLNDTYRIDAVEDGKGGGFGRVATLLKHARQDNSNVMIVHAGDFIAPSLESRFFQGRQMIDALNYLAALAPLHVVPGNHEFDEKDPSMLANAIKGSSFSWVASNLKLSTSDPEADLKVVPREIVEAGNLRLGIFALTIHGAQGGGDQPYAQVGFQEKYVISDDALAEARSELGDDAIKVLQQLKGRQFDSQNDFKSTLAQASGSSQSGEALFASAADYFFSGYSALAEREIIALERDGANVIIALTHLNMSDDRQIARLRQNHPSFIWIAGGHEHYAQEGALSGQSALITKADSNARSVWKVAISLNDQKPEISAEKILINESTFGLDWNYQRQIVDAYHDKLKQRMGYLDRTIGNVSQVNSDRCFEATEEVVRNEQSDWGAFLADRMRNAYANQKAQIGVLNGGTIRIDDNFCDAIRYEQMERSIGFSTNVVYVKLSGADLKREILEHAVGTKRGDGRFLQVAGLRFDFNRFRSPGDRVFNVLVNQGNSWTDLNPKAAYSVAVSEYLFNCGDDYDFRRFVTEYIPPGPDLRALVIDSFNRTKTPNIANSTLGGVLEVPTYLKGWRVQNAQFLPIGNNNRCPRRN